MAKLIQRFAHGGSTLVATRDTSGTVYTVSGLKPATTATLYANGTSTATATVDGTGKATWTLSSAPAAGTVLTFEATVRGSAGTVGSGGTQPGGGTGGGTGPAHAPTSTQLFPTYNDLTVNALFDYFAGNKAWQLAPGVITIDLDNSGTSVRYASVILEPNTTYTMEGVFTRRAGSGTGVVEANVYLPNATTQPTAVIGPVVDGQPYQTYVTFTTDGSGDTHFGFAYIGSDPAKRGGVLDYGNLVFTKGSTRQYLPTDAFYVPPLDHFVLDMFTTQSFPTALPPQDNSVQPTYGTLAAGSTNLLVIDHTPGTGSHKVNTRAAFDAVRFSNHITGTFENATGPDNDDPTAGASFAYIGHYPESSPANNLTFTSQGVKYGVSGLNNNQGRNGDKKFGIKELRAAYARFEQNFLPGDYVEIDFIGPKHALAWMPFWLYRGRQVSHRRAGVNGPYDSVTNQYGSNLPLFDFHSESYQEIDLLDMYNKPPGVGRCLTSGTVIRGGEDSRATKPYAKTFIASDGGFTNDGWHAISDIQWNQDTPNTLGFYWKNDGTHTLVYTLNGKVFMEEYWEFWSHNFTDPITGVVEPVGMHLIIGGQGVPITFGTILGDAPIADGAYLPNLDEMSLTVAGLRAWRTTGVSGLIRGSSSVSPPAGYPGAAGTTPPANTGNKTKLTFGSTGYASSSVNPTVGANPFSVEATFIPAQADLGVEFTPFNAWGDNYFVQTNWLLSFPNGCPQLAFTPDGLSFYIAKAGNLGMVAGVKTRVRAEYDPVSGNTQFYTYPNDVKTAFGSPVYGGGARGVRHTDEAWAGMGRDNYGGSQMQGSFMAARLEINGTLALAPTVASNGTITDATGATWTVGGSATFE